MNEKVNRGLNLIAGEILRKSLNNDEKKELFTYLKMYAEAVVNSIETYEPTTTMKKMNKVVVDSYVKYDTQELLAKYFVKGQWCSRYSMIPIEYRNHPGMIDFIREHKCRVRYRGPRRRLPQTAIDNGLRSPYGKCITMTGQATCLKHDATHFTLYPNAR